jgi:hypothetical protein
MQTLDAHADIDAPAELVWQVVADLPRYAEWNPFVVRASGEPAVGAKLRVTIVAPGHRAVTFRPRVLRLDPGHELTWLGRTLLPGLFDGRHSLRVEPLGDGRSRFTTHEEVTGVLLPVLGGVMRDSQRGFELFAQAVKRRAEALAAEAPAATAPEA